MNASQKFSPSDKFKIAVVSVFLVIPLIILGFLVGILLRPRQFDFSLPTSLTQSTPTSTLPLAVPTTSLARTECKSKTLLLGGTTFQIQDLRREADGSLAIPGDTSGIAYRIDGIESNEVFIMSPTPQNMTVMSSISVGSPVTAMGPGCTPITYSLTAPQAGRLEGSIFASAATDSITIFFPTVSSGEGFTFKGRRVTEPVVALNQPTATMETILSLPPTGTSTASTVVGITTASSIIPTEQSIASPTPEKAIPTSTVAVPTPDYSEILAEIGLVDTSLSLFRTSLKIEVSIYNFGKIPIHLSQNDVSLTQPDGSVLTLKSSKPSLPTDIQPGETKTIEFNFQTPSSSTATLRVLTVEYDVDGY